MLRKLGHTVDIVGNGCEAVAAVENGRYDAVLMDVQLPRMDGLEATRQIVAEMPVGMRPYIIAMTASALVVDRDACSAAGMDDFVSKPVRSHDLATVLAAVSTSSR